MSTTPKKKKTQRVRYTDAQKKEVVDFVASHNASNGRGGQSAAAKKFKISQITVAAWLKGAGAAAPKASKAAKAPKAAKKAKAAKKSSGKSKVGTRYTDAQKKEVVDFTIAYNAANGRGGQSKAAAKFKVSPLTVMAWLKAAGVKGASKKSTKKVSKTSSKVVSGGSNAKLGSLLALGKEIAKAEAALAQLKGKFNSLLASL